jgi:hypothetical protein
MKELSKLLFKECGVPEIENIEDVGNTSLIIIEKIKEVERLQKELTDKKKNLKILLKSVLTS